MVFFHRLKTAWAFHWTRRDNHYCDVIMDAVASQITSLTIVYSTVYSDEDQRKHQSSASLAFVRETGEFPAQTTSNAENVSIWWRHHETRVTFVSSGPGWYLKLFERYFYRSCFVSCLFIPYFTVMTSALRVTPTAAVHVTTIYQFVHQGESSIFRHVMLGVPR